VGWTFDFDFFIPGRLVVLGLAKAEQLVLVINIVGDEVNEVNMTLDEGNEKALHMGKGEPGILRGLKVFIESMYPGFQ
jgi:hypothetical protein